MDDVYILFDDDYLATVKIYELLQNSVYFIDNSKNSNNNSNSNNNVNINVNRDTRDVCVCVCLWLVATTSNINNNNQICKVDVYNLCNLYMERDNLW